MWGVGGTLIGGGCEIRTHGRIAPSPDFKSGALNRSANPPSHCTLQCPFGVDFPVFSPLGGSPLKPGLPSHTLITSPSWARTNLQRRKHATRNPAHGARRVPDART